MNTRLHNAKLDLEWAWARYDENTGDLGHAFESLHGAVKEIIRYLEEQERNQETTKPNRATK